MTRTAQPRGTSFDFFGTLVTVDTPDDPAEVVACELEARGVSVPENWEKTYRTPQIDAAPGAEISLSVHVRKALENNGVRIPPSEEGVLEDAVLAAFQADVQTREGAPEAVSAAKEAGPVGVLSNCSVPGLVERSLGQSTLEDATFDAVVTSVDCGWRKPDQRAFETVATELGVDRKNLVHVGDDPETDGGASDAGATAVLVEDVPLEALPEFITEDGRN